MLSKLVKLMKTLAGCVHNTTIYLMKFTPNFVKFKL